MDILKLQNITKTYPGVKALDDVSISFQQGEVHAIVGENGAGKSTLIKTVSGAISPDSGSIEFDGVEYRALTPEKALELGISVVYQELIQFEAMSITDNIFMSSDRGVFVDRTGRSAKAKELLDRFHSRLDTDTTVRELSTANRQIVEMAKALMRNARLIIFDEPTASITVEEQKRLFEIIRGLKAEGMTVIYISHRLDELFEICDRVSVLRDGSFVKTLDIARTDRSELVELMVGRKLSDAYPVKSGKGAGEVVLEVRNLCGNGVKDISFQLHKGEILGFAGLVGAGRTELMHLIYGAAEKEAGEVLLKGNAVEIHSPYDAMRAGLGLIPEDRKEQGCFLDKPICWNISVSNIRELCRGIFVDEKKEQSQAEEYRKKLRIKAPDMSVNVGTLSGGNQQKVVISKTLAAMPDILIFDEPTRGIDVGAKYEIYQFMIDLTSLGKSILMVSSEMDELLGMSERLVVLCEGRQTGILEKKDFSQQTVLKLASGIEGGTT